MSTLFEAELMNADAGYFVWVHYEDFTNHHQETPIGRLSLSHGKTTIETDSVAFTEMMFDPMPNMAFSALPMIRVLGHFKPTDLFTFYIEQLVRLGGVAGIQAMIESLASHAARSGELTAQKEMRAALGLTK